MYVYMCVNIYIYMYQNTMYIWAPCDIYTDLHAYIHTYVVDAGRLKQKKVVHVHTYRHLYMHKFIYTHTYKNAYTHSLR